MATSEGKSCVGNIVESIANDDSVGGNAAVSTVAALRAAASRGATFTEAAAVLASATWWLF